ncbi:MAG: hypothetical protein HY367_03390 [Candidatus Aenigmarchaeota archaeon]|nr:hypothetical protein [Candidatus Aenigmarchaeota archaeon]
MVSSEVVRYVREQVKAGFSMEEIEYALLDAGYTTAEVSEIMKFAEEQPRPQPQMPVMPRPVMQGPRPMPMMPMQRPQLPFQPSQQWQPPLASSAMPQGKPKTGKALVGFIVSFIGALFLMVNAIMMLVTSNADIIPRVPLSGLDFSLGFELSILSIITLILAVGMLAAAFFMLARPSKARIFGVFVLVLAMLSFVSMGSFAMGAIIGIVGGIIGIIKK